MSSNDKEACCSTMREQLNYKCEQHGNGPLCPDVIVAKDTSCSAGLNSKILLGRNADYICRYCPWCGTKQ